jgi:hypothetical protein
MITTPGTLEFAKYVIPLQWFDGGSSENLPYALAN